MSPVEPATARTGVSVTNHQSGTLPAGVIVHISVTWSTLQGTELDEILKALTEVYAGAAGAVDDKLKAVPG